MASKKAWRKRAKYLEQENYNLFVRSTERAAELATIDTMLHNVEFPGPTIDAYVAQTQQFLQRLIEVRGIVKKPRLVERFVVSSPRQDQSPDGEYTFLTEENLTPFAGPGAARG